MGNVNQSAGISYPVELFIEMIKRLIRALKDVVVGKPLAVRSSRWEKVRKGHLKLFPMCAACGCNIDLQVHHIVPFHIDRSLELVPSNLITLCEGKGEHKCHLNIGHLGNFRKENPEVIEDAKEFLKKINSMR